MTHVWLYNPATEAYWNAPAGIAERLKAGGWEDRGAPVEPNPATDEHAAWRAAEEARQAAAYEALATAEAPAEGDKPTTKPKSTTPKSAASGESQEG